MLSDLARTWNALYNGVAISDPALGYLVLSGLRVLIAYASWRLVVALIAYLRVAFPPPHTLANVQYWLRWWLWLRLREFPLLKLGIVLTAFLLLLQIPAGASGALNVATWYLLLIYPAWLAALIGMAQLLHVLRQRVEHPDQT